MRNADLAGVHDHKTLLLPPQLSPAIPSDR